MICFVTVRDASNLVQKLSSCGSFVQHLTLSFFFLSACAFRFAIPPFQVPIPWYGYMHL